MTITTIDGLRSAFQVARKALGPDNQGDFQFRTTPSHDGSPHVEMEGPFFLYICTDRGTVTERRRTDDPDELLYWLFQDLTFSIASRYELEHRRPGEDSRRQLFAKQEELLRLVAARWADRYSREVGRLLLEHPFTA